MAANVRQLRPEAAPATAPAPRTAAAQMQLEALDDPAVEARLESIVLSAFEKYRAGAAPEPELVDGAEMCRRIGVSRTSLHRLRVAGAPAVRVGDTYRYRPGAVVAWLEQREAKP